MALTIACSDGSITGPELVAPRTGKANVALNTRIVYLGAAHSAPINYIRAAVYDTVTGERLAFIDQTLDPAKNSFDFYFPVPLPLGSAVPAKLTIELANRTATSEVVEYSGRRTDLVLKSGDFKQIEIDIYPGPLSNFDVTGVAIAKPIAERIEGDSVQATAKISGNSVDARVSWTSLDDSIASVGADGVVHGLLPGVARIVAAVGEHSDTAAITVRVKRAAVVISPAQIDLPQAGDTATFSATVVDPRGKPIVGDSVVWSVSDTTSARIVSAGRFVLRRVGKSIISAAARGAPQVSASGSITAKAAGAVSVSKSTITATPTSMTADGTSTAAVTVRLLDANGNPVPDAHVSLANSGTGVLSAVTDNRDGSYSASLTAPTAVGSASISATVDANALGPVAVTFGAGPATRYVVTVTAASTAPGAARTVSVRLTDANGNTVSIPGRVISWIDSGTGGTFSSGTSLTDSTGSASVTFTPGIGTDVSHSITATDNGAPAATGTSAPFVTTVSAPASAPVTPTVPVTLPATRLRIVTAAAGAVSGAAFVTQPAIEITDSTGARVNADTSSVVTMTVSSGASVFGTAIATAKSGIATFTTAGISGIAGTAYTLTFASAPLSSATQGIVTTAGAASQLAITTQAAGATSGAAFTTQPVVTIRDAVGNTRTSDNSTTVTMTVSAGATIIGTASVTAANGVAAFTNVGLSGTDGAAYTLTFSSGGLTPASQTATVSAARVVIGAASMLAVSTAPAGAASGAAFSTQPVIAIRDANGNTVTSDNSSIVTMTVGGDGSVVGTATATAVNGTASFANVGISGASGVVYTLTFAATGLTPVTQSITPTAGAAAQLIIARSAAGASSGAAFSTQPIVEVRDAYGNTRTADNTTVITLSASSGASVVGTADKTASSGAANYAGVGISGTAGTSYTLTFSASGLSSATQSITPSAGGATQLALTTFAAGASSGAAFSTQPVVTLRDAAGNTATSNSTAIVTMTVSSGATVVGTATATASSGVATFSDVGITGQPGTGYTLTFAATGLASATQSITPTAGAASTLAVTTSAAGSASGAAFSTQPVVAVCDALGNTLTSDNATVVTMTVSSGGTVIGTATATAANGLATFTNVGISGTAGTAYTLTFSASGLTSATQNITPTAGAATQLALTTSAAGAPSGASFLTQPVVTLRDGAGNTATANSTAMVTMTVSSGATVVGTATATASSGVATFSDVGITGTAGTVYTLTFASSGLSSVTQSITASASQGSLALTTSAAGAASGAAFATQPVIAVRDANGSTATTDNSTVVTITVSSGATVVGTATATASSGIATFTNVGISGAAGTAYTLTFAATGLASATQSITPTAGAASKLVLTTSASGAASGAAFSTQPVVTVRDAFGNTLTADNATVVTMSVSSGGTVIGTATATAANGIATFANVGISGTAGTAYTLTYSASGLTSATQSITPTAGTLDHFSITATDGTAAGTQTVNVAGAFKISALDAAANVVTSFTSSVSLTATGATLSGSPVTTAAFSSGVLASQSLTFTSTGGSVSIIATGSSKTGTSATFAVTNQTLAMATQPSGAASGSVMTTVPAIQLKDNGANQSLAGVTVSASVATQPSSGASLAISGGAASAITNSSGVATFTNLVLSGTTGAYTLKFTASGYANVISNSFTLAAGVATQIVMSGPDTIVSQAVSEPITITLKDAAGNTTTAGTGGVTIVMSTDGTGTFYSDQAGTNALASNQISIASGSSTATVYYQDTQVLSSPVTRTITAAKVGGGLASGTFHLYTKSAATASQRLVCKTRGNPNNSSSFVDITGCSAIASGHRLLIGVSVAGTVTMSADSSGWTLVSSAQATGSGSEKLTMAVFQKTATSADNATSSYRFHWTGSGNTNLKNVASLVVYKNATVDVSATKSSSTGGTTASTNPATPSTTSTTAVYWFGLSSGESTADIVANWTISKDLYTETLAAGNSNSASILAADVDRQTQSTYQSRSAANAALSSSSAWIGIVTVLK